MSSPEPVAAPAPSRPDWVEIAAMVLLAVAALATAWSSYQAARWNGEQVKAGARANALRTEASRAADLASSQTEVDVAVFTQWVNATAVGDQPLQDFYVARFRPEFRPAFDAWLASKPLTNAQAPSSPFAMPEYQLAAKADAQRLDTETAAAAALVPEYVQRSSNYVLGVVLFAVALFFAGMSARLRRSGASTFLVILGLVVFVGAVTWILSMPVSVGV